MTAGRAHEAAPNPSTAMARAMIDELARGGVRHVVLAPGSRSAALAFALHDHPVLALHVHPDERSAGFVALGIARMSQRPAVVVTTSGSAVANLHPAVIEADLDRVPLVLLTADRPVELRATGANQTIEQAGLFGSAARWSFDVPAAEDRSDAPRVWRSVIARAIAASMGSAGPAGPPGPVHLNVGFREPTVPATDDGRSPPAPWFHEDRVPRDDRPSVWVHAGDRAPSEQAVAAVLGAVLDEGRARRGIVVVGQSRRRLGGVVALARRLGWPVLAEPTGDVRSDPSVITHGHQLCSHAGFVDRHRPQVVLRFGRATLSPSIDAAVADTEQVLVDQDGAWTDPDRRLAGIVVAEPELLAAALTERLDDDAASAPSWIDGWRNAQRIAAQAIDEALAVGGSPQQPAPPSGPTRPAGVLSEPAVARRLPCAVPPGTVVVAASSMPIRDLDRYMPAGCDVHIDANRGAAGIDGFVGSLLGVRLATDPDRAVVGLAGDLASLHDSNGWLLSVDGRSPAGSVTLVVVDNDGGGIFSFLPQARYPEVFERTFGTPHGRDLAHLAALHGLSYHAAATVDELDTALAATTARPGRHLIHVVTTRADNAALHRRLDAAVAERLSAHW